jgi:hypothetical protein
MCNQIEIRPNPAVLIAKTIVDDKLLCLGFLLCQTGLHSLI